MNFLPIISITVIFMVSSVFGSKLCEDIITVRDNNHEVVPNVIYFEDRKMQKAEIFCESQNSEVVELVSNTKSLGVIENDEHHTAICRLGRWYALDKYNELTVVKHVGCLVHD